MADGRTGSKGAEGEDSSIVVCTVLRHVVEQSYSWDEEDFYEGYAERTREILTPYVHHLIFNNSEKTLTVKMYMPEKSNPDDKLPKRAPHKLLPAPAMHIFPIPEDTIATDLSEHLDFLKVMQDVFALGEGLKTERYKEFIMSGSKNYVSIRGPAKKKGGHIKPPPHSEVAEYYRPLYNSFFLEARGCVWADTSNKTFSIFVAQVYAYAHVSSKYPPEDPSKKHG